jgi:ElaB/YqjD/DUF883 family membrane-anchored ribosome-binding protein
MSQPAYDVEPRDSYDDQETSLGNTEVQAARARVEHTRAEMGETIDAIKDKLEPRHLVDQAKESVREATIGRAQHAMEGVVERARDTVETVSDTAQDYTSGMMRIIRENPIPAAMIGVGIGWLLMSMRSGRNGREFRHSRRESWHRDDAYTHRYEDPAWAGVGAAPGYRGHEPSETGVREKAGEMAGRVQEKAGEMADRMKEKAGHVKERAGEMAERVQEGAHEVQERARYRARQTMDAVQSAMEENPLAVGAVAMAIGAAVGLLLPETQKERELMGETRERLMHRAQETAQDLGQKVQHVAREAVGAAKDAAKEEGLMQETQQKAA